MKNIHLLLISIIIILFGCLDNNNLAEPNTPETNMQNNPEDKIGIPGNPTEIKVLVFAGDGAPTTRSVELSLRQNNQYNLVDGYYFIVTRIFSKPNDKLDSDILEQYDVLLIPGGYPSRMQYSLVKADIQDWVSRGGGYVGICAGEILAVEGSVANSIFGSFEGLEIAPGISRETSDWVGERNIRMTEPGANLLGLSGDQRMMQWNGSSFTISPNSINNYIIFATYFNNSLDRESFEFGASRWKESFDNRIAILGQNFGQGRVILSGPHPEESSKSNSLQKARLLGAMIKWAYQDDTPITFSIGRNDILTEDDMSKNLRAMSGIVSADSLISNINIYIKEGTGRVIAGIYNSNEFMLPGDLLVQSEPLSINSSEPGWLTVPLEN